MGRPRTSVCGVGINDVPCKTDRAYRFWNSMLQRCYNAGRQATRPTYAGCSVHPSWHRFSAFQAWFDRNYVPGYQLDKDILIPGNKVYGPYTCCFVPARINQLLVDSLRCRGGLPRGVTNNNGSYMAQCRSSADKTSKTFRTIEEAACWYRETKSRVIRKAATDALVCREISLRVHAGLLRHGALIEFG